MPTGRIAGDSDKTANVLNNLGTLYIDMKRFEEAQPLYEQALSMLKNIFDEEHYKVASTINNLASLHNRKGEHQRAIEEYKKSLEITIKTVGTKEHVNAAATLNNIGAAYVTLGNDLAKKGEKQEAQKAYGEARDYIEQAVTIRLKKLGDKHHHTIVSQKWQTIIVTKMRELVTQGQAQPQAPVNAQNNPLVTDDADVKTEKSTSANQQTLQLEPAENNNSATIIQTSHKMKNKTIRDAV